MVALLAALALPGVALAQTEESTSIPIQQYEPGPGAEDILGVQSGQIQKALGWHVGAHLNFADDVLEVRDAGFDTTFNRIIESQVGFDIIGAIGLRDTFEIGIVLPFTPYRNHGGEPPPNVPTDLVPSDLSGAALGDIRLMPKVKIPGLPDSIQMALSAPLTLPTGKGDQFYGEGSVGIEPRLLFTYLLSNGTAIAANLGFRVRSEKKFLNLVLGNEITFGAGTRYPFKLAGKQFAAVGTIVGSAGLSETNQEEVPLELLVGGEFHPIDNLRVGVAGGPGLTRGYGTPDFRLLANVSYRRRPKEKPPCPYGPDSEDIDGYQDDDACEDPDNDDDGIADDIDMCPNEKETFNGDKDDDGCPEDPRLKNREPLPELEVVDDKDGDGIEGRDDLCPDKPEDKDGHADLDGCPDPDNDDDGILDVDDACPLRAEVINGNEDTDGCPDQGKALVQLTVKKLVILDKVYFDTNKATIKERSFNVLDQVAATLRANKQITKLRIEGHTDSHGKDAYNMTLSQNRTQSVKQYLINKGIDADRMEAKGFGETRFIDTNKTKKGRANNRRVEFVITEIDGKPIPEDEGTKPLEVEAKP